MVSVLDGYSVRRASSVGDLESCALFPNNISTVFAAEIDVRIVTHMIADQSKVLSRQ